jgi:hypothetical protein
LLVSEVDAVLSEVDVANEAGRGERCSRVASADTGHLEELALSQDLDERQTLRTAFDYLSRHLICTLLRISLSLDIYSMNQLRAVDEGSWSWRAGERRDDVRR